MVAGLGAVARTGLARTLGAATAGIGAEEPTAVRPRPRQLRARALSRGTFLAIELDLHQGV